MLRESNGLLSPGVHTVVPSGPPSRQTSGAAQSPQGAGFAVLLERELSPSGVEILLPSRAASSLLEPSPAVSAARDERGGGFEERLKEWKKGIENDMEVAAEVKRASYRVGDAGAFWRGGTDKYVEALRKSSKELGVVDELSRLLKKHVQEIVREPGAAFDAPFKERFGSETARQSSLDRGELLDLVSEGVTGAAVVCGVGSAAAAQAAGVACVDAYTGEKVRAQECAQVSRHTEAKLLVTKEHATQAQLKSAKLQVGVEKKSWAHMFGLDTQKMDQLKEKVRQLKEKLGKSKSKLTHAKTKAKGAGMLTKALAAATKVGLSLSGCLLLVGGVLYSARVVWTLKRRADVRQEHVDGEVRRMAEFCCEWVMKKRREVGGSVSVRGSAVTLASAHGEGEEGV
uniref:Uncharacterized protein n=1 Tax=Chromera velia CCMP2878 TaxID=1169474 RepID=A0A0G4FLW1_9ALVE|eukprot:Cvel_17651.t1-p1 / transcript=Cvel_17651.t1 / gene=Cvel_17651 / organism=Chromera_velia_CCMP2878 / gene_product=hypothetical protein / transcript_product=hypothetical protein / location=Cvel_scaffold1421:38592-40410(-) / protein_length=399 / sequence_SO=supercontig / SO=protein_coding / is_pseudo=false